MNRKRKGAGTRRRRAAVAVTVAVTVPVLIGFAALSVDVGVMYNAKADLQRAADAAAMAAASRLTSIGNNPIALARQTAKDTALANPVLTQAPVITDGDIVFGKANINPFTNQVSFVATETIPDAVRVTVRKTADSPNGALQLYFARIFGRNFTDVEATATAAVAPRDIAIVSDISGSLVFDSEFRRWEDTQINIYDVWNELPGGAGEINSTWSPGEVLADPAQSAGPAYGYFKRMGFGDDPADQNSYDVDSDPGLVELVNGQRWNNADLAAFLYDQQYNTSEVNAILNTTSTSYYENRVALALGLATWNSGMSGGRWSKVGESKVGNGNTVYGDSEINWVAPCLSTSANQAESIWRDYINRYSSSRSSPFPSKFGIKTWLDYTLEYRRSESQTPELADVPVQPMESIKEATKYMVDLLTNARSFDQISLEVYSSTASHRVDLTHNFADVTAVLDSVVPSGSTNIGQGIERGVSELTSQRARGEAKKVILLITDGQANVDEWGRSSEYGGKQYALSAAQNAVDQGIEIVTISVGSDADQDLMQQIADLSGSVHFHAEGTIDQYTAELQQIFAAVGGRRTVELIE